MTNNEGQALSASVSVGRSFLALLIVALLVMLSFVGAYVLNFHHEGLSSSKEVWALFGEYVGGTVGPLLGFFTLIGVILTVALQAQQLQDSRKQLQTASVELDNSRKLQLDTVKALTEQAAHADIAAKALIQQAGYADQSAKAMTQQAVYGSLAARIAALNAAMSVVGEQIRPYDGKAMDTNAFATYQGLLEQKGRLAKDIIDLSDKILKGEQGPG